MVEVSNLTHIYQGGHKALENLSFTVKKGEIIGLLGPNGAGKSTTVKMITGILKPTSGSVKVSGYEVTDSLDEIRKLIGFMPQETALYQDLTAYEALEYHAELYGVPKEEVKDRIAKMLELAGLTNRKDDLVKTYSGGMKRRLEIARGLMHYPTVLFLDEPTLGLDAQTRRAIWAYIKKMNKEEDTTIFLTTHYMDEADQVCDRVGIIDRGKLLVIDTTENLKNSVGNDVITLSCSEMDKLVNRLEKEHWIKNTKIHDSFLTVGVEKGEEKIPVVIEIAQSLGIRIKSISLRKPTLDDVFLYYTGRTMRDDEPEHPWKKFARKQFMRGA